MTATKCCSFAIKRYVYCCMFTANGFGVLSDRFSIVMLSDSTVSFCNVAPFLNPGLPLPRSQPLPLPHHPPPPSPSPYPVKALIAPASYLFDLMGMDLH